MKCGSRRAEEELPLHSSALALADNAVAAGVVLQNAAAVAPGKNRAVAAALLANVLCHWDW